MRNLKHYEMTPLRDEMRQCANQNAVLVLKSAPLPFQGKPAYERLPPFLPDF